jgi:hypothetical protein
MVAWLARHSARFHTTRAIALIEADGILNDASCEPSSPDRAVRQFQLPPGSATATIGAAAPGCRCAISLAHTSKVGIRLHHGHGCGHGAPEDHHKHRGPAMAPAEIVLKITLRGIRPPVWRRVRVSSDMTLRTLHQVIQEAMGWEDAHLHEFEAGNRRYGEPSDDDWPGMERTFNENGIKLGRLVEQGVRRFQYLYDFGDGWEHAVAIEKVGPLDPDQQYPSLITGKRACPPEDCGGVPGYYRLLEVLADPSDEEHAHLTEWVGGEFDPERFDAVAINAALAAMARRRRASGRRARPTS